MIPRKCGSLIRAEGKITGGKINAPRSLLRGALIFVVLLLFFVHN